ncbi:MAG: hypothetical protein ACK45E_07855 [Ignavibacteria bacterium]|jgi:hypothetical protein
MRYTTVVMLLVGVLAGMGVMGCSDDLVLPEPNFVLESGLANPILVQTKKPSDQVEKGETVVSLSVRRVRVLVSRIMLHTDRDTTGGDDKTVKAGPFIYEADSLGTRVISSVNLPAGSYNRLKFEVHRFSSSETSVYTDDPVYRDFVTGDRYSVIIDGYVVRKNGTASSFTYKSDVTSNLELGYEPAIVVTEGAVTTSTITFDAAAVFKDGSEILDPADADNESFIDNGIKRAFRTNR